jgi:predicted RNA-binding protein Jag
VDDLKNRTPESHDIYQNVNRIDRILIDVQKKLKNSFNSVTVDQLNAFERKRIHSFFDHKPEYQTKTYNEDGKYVLRVFPIANLKKEADQKAKYVLESGETIAFSNLGKYERFLVHDHLKNLDGIETVSIGEGEERTLYIKKKQFGRSLKRIIKKIKIF